MAQPWQTVRVGVVYDFYNESQDFISRTLTPTSDLSTTITPTTAGLNSQFNVLVPASARFVRVGYLLELRANTSSIVVLRINSPRTYLSVTTKMVGNAAIGYEQLADGAVRMATLAPAVVTSLRDASLLVGAYVNAPGGRLVSPRGEELVPGFFAIANLRSNNATTLTQTVQNATWTSLIIPTPAQASHVTLYNSMGLTINPNNWIDFPVGGVYDVEANCVFGNATGGTARSLAFSISGGPMIEEAALRLPSYVNAVMLVKVRGKLRIGAGGNVRVMMRQDSGTALPLCRIEDITIKFLGSE